ncbi:MAG TPA: ubiquinone biosynthesis regulatory protein kinase UbiB [Rhodanobacteraceae bacterium]|nr:ubiquinone biosynthesis regulatory protein kinase UbiB [Rhodanobacteraceae bacterium]
MMTALRLLRVAAVLLRYRLDELLDAAHLYRPLKLLRPLLPKPRADIARLSRGERLRLALTDLGPIFVKFGQILSTRRDLLPADVAEELASLQDRVPPFPGAEARAIIERALRAPVAELFAEFSEQPLASASIAQVHPARLRDGREVVVKVARPGVGERIKRDIKVLYSLARLVQRYHPNADKIRPLDVAEEVEKTLVNELDLQREAANASLLRRNYEGSNDLYVPLIHWSHSTPEVLTMERVRGVRSDDIEALDALGIDRKRLAAKGVRLFYEQVFRDNFFHADAHPGNIWVDSSRREEPRFIALDFGIMGSLPEADQYWLAENFIALFERDYQRIASLHVAAGWIPATTRLDELEAAARTVCEPYFTRPLSEISLAEVMMKLFQTARKFELTLQPQLILLQKTLLNIEGLGRQLDPEIDIWKVAYPVLKRILRERYSPRRALKELSRRIPQWLQAAPDVPDMARELLHRAVRGEQRVHIDSHELAQLNVGARSTQRAVAGGLLGIGFMIVAALVWLVPPAHGPWWSIGLACAALLAFAWAWPRHRH